MSDSYRVIAPYVIAKTATPDGVRMVGLGKGAMVPADVPESWLAHHLRKKMIAPIATQPEPQPAQDQGATADSTKVPPPPPAAPPAPGTPQAPPTTGPGSGQAAWVDYAVARGMDRDEAIAMKRDDLIAALRED